ncbi:mannonate dehydratase [Haloarcula marina]|uniref:mannonate dehydratase n=1 Tax=Haloarcula marina TaxID=2961574 RepID=UPI0020B6D125|nr:mannonate dehydratase [Halomicroarcula marina]
MQIALMLNPEEDVRWQLARQMGVTNAVTRLPTTVSDGTPWETPALRDLQTRLEESGLELAVIEGRPPMDKIILGRDGREEQAEAVCTLLENMGQLGIPVWCSTFSLDVYRTSREIPGRGGSLVTGYDHEIMNQTDDSPAEMITEGDDWISRRPTVSGPPVGPVGTLSEADLWENMEWFVERVAPVAEEAGVKMALHPDDPPISAVNDVARIATSVENYDRILSMYDSEYHGITMCQGNFAAMGADVPEAIRHFGDRVNFVHFRDVVGESHSFTETWHDNGPTDMAAVIEAYSDIGYDGLARPDHVPHTARQQDRGNDGRLFAVGYMRGLLEATARANDGYTAG